MQVNFNPSVAFHAQQDVNNKVNNTQQNLPNTTEPQKDTAFNRTKNGVKNVWDFGINTTQFVKGLVNGVVAAAVTTATVLGIDWTVSSGSKVLKDEMSALTMIKKPFVVAGKFISKSAAKFSSLFDEGAKPLKMIAKGIIKLPKKIITSIKSLENVSKFGKIAAPVLGGLAFVGAMIKARLNANQKTADVDHKLRTGHRV